LHSLLIVNPTSGQGKAAREKRRLLDLVSNMSHIHVEVPASAEATTEIARSASAQGFDRVLVAGGDGTINRVVSGIGESGMPMGIIPLGTGNVLAHDLGIPSNDIVSALKIISADNIRAVDLGRAGDRLFLLMAGFGFDAEVIGSVSPKVKDVIGTMAYAAPVFKKLMTYTPARFRLIFNDDSNYEVEAYAVILANCGSYAYNLQIAPQAVFDDGLLDIIIFETGPGSMFRFVGQALEVFFQKRILDPYTTYFKSSSVRIETEPLVKMQIDGDVCGEGATRVEVIHKALKLIVP
jgi:YegS/Rv2252/BmrU family lipid kinase